MKAIFKVHFDNGLNLPYEFAYDTGLVETVTVENEEGTFSIEVPLIVGGYTIIENIDENTTEVLVEIETSEDVFQQLLQDTSVTLIDILQ